MMRPGPCRLPERTSLAGASTMETKSAWSAACLSQRGRVDENGLLPNWRRQPVAVYVGEPRASLGAAAVGLAGAVARQRLCRKIDVGFIVCADMLSNQFALEGQGIGSN